MQFFVTVNKLICKKKNQAKYIIFPILLVPISCMTIVTALNKINPTNPRWLDYVIFVGFCLFTIIACLILSFVFLFFVFDFFFVLCLCLMCCFPCLLLCPLGFFFQSKCKLKNNKKFEKKRYFRYNNLWVVLYDHNMHSMFCNFCN